jgi:hypothetical protein
MVWGEYQYWFKSLFSTVPATNLFFLSDKMDSIAPARKQTSVSSSLLFFPTSTLPKTDQTDL